MRPTVEARGLVPQYDGGRCPGCGLNHWHVGSITAECARCGTALPLGEPHSHLPSNIMLRVGKGPWRPGRWTK
jgi:hypothetical protein